MKKRIKPLNLVSPRAEFGTIASYPALPLEQNGQKFFITTIPKEDIFPYTYVSDRNEDPEKGFQRSLDEKRARDIADYLDQSKGSIPTNVVLSAQEDSELRYLSKSKLIKFCRRPSSFLVLDGQHRLYGYGMTKKQHRIPVAIYLGLSRKQEVSLFMDINTTQRGVPAALLLDIKHIADRETEMEMKSRELFDFLANESDSPLNGLLSAAKSSRGKIARPTFNRAAAHIFKSPVMEKLSKDKQHTLVKNFFKALEKNSRERKWFTTSVYFESICVVFDDVLQLSREQYGDYKLGSIFEVLAPVNQVDLTIINTRTSRLTTVPIVRALKDVLSAQFDVSDDMI